MPQNVKGIALQRFFETQNATMAEAVTSVDVSTTYISKWLRVADRDIQPIGRRGNATLYGHVAGSGSLNPDHMSEPHPGNQQPAGKTKIPSNAVAIGPNLMLATFMLGEAVTLRVIGARLVSDHVEYELTDEAGHVFTLGVAA